MNEKGRIESNEVTWEKPLSPSGQRNAGGVRGAAREEMVEKVEAEEKARAEELQKKKRTLSYMILTRSPTCPSSSIAHWTTRTATSTRSSCSKPSTKPAWRRLLHGAEHAHEPGPAGFEVDGKDVDGSTRSSTPY